MALQRFQVVYFKTMSVVGYVTAKGANTALRKASKELNYAIRHITVTTC